MPFSWNDYILLADQLNTGSPNDAQMRTATSRAYYGAFCLCRNKKGLSADRRPNIHQVVIDEFKNSDDSIEYSIGNTLDGLRGKRVDADYKISYKPNPQTTKLDIKNAESIVSLLNQVSD